MNTNFKLLDVVALGKDLQKDGLVKGQVGTIIEELSPNEFIVEFCDNNGKTYALKTLNSNQVIPLHFHLQSVSPGSKHPQV